MRKSSIALCVIGFLGLACFIAGCLLIHFMPIIIDNQIKDNVKISSSSAAYDNWKSPKSPIYFQVWAFDVINYKDVMKGGQPSVEQKGPYTYRETREKLDINFHDNGTVDYRENKTYNFVPEMSVGSENDTFRTINIPLITVIDQANYQSIFNKVAVEFVIIDSKAEMFYEKSIKDLLWGYKDPFLTDLVEKMKLAGISLNISDEFGLFYQTNGTDDGLYEIRTGEGDIDKIGEITSWNEAAHLSFWTSDSANQINGSDGTMYAPFVDIKTTKYLFSSDLCRSIGMDYTEEVDHRGISMKRFVAPESVFVNATINPGNEGFCTPNETHCLPSGLLNVSNCRQGAPIVMSMPHFLGCDPDIIHSIKGLSPNQSEHQSFIDIEPETGVVMNVAKRLQINIHLKPVEDFSLTENFTHMYLPVIWVNESALIDEKDADDFKDEVFGKMKLGEGLKYGLIGLGLLIMLVVAIVAILMKRRNKSDYQKFENSKDRKDDKDAEDADDAEGDGINS